MTDDTWRAELLPVDSMRIMQMLVRRGGGLRMRALIALSGMSADQLLVALRALHERLWIEIVWRSNEAGQDTSLPERFREVRRIATTHTGRHCFPYLPWYR
jgi:hypothetical protein